MNTDFSSFDQLPQSISLLHAKVDGLYKLFTGQQVSQQQEPEVQFNINQLCEYLPWKPAKQTIYQNKDIPSHKRGKFKYYLKSEIDAWLKAGKPTQNDAATSADAFLSNSKTKRRA